MSRRSPLKILNINGLGLRISEPFEVIAAKELIRQGYVVVKRGWPDFLAVRGEEIRFIEVKGPYGRLKEHQYYMAEILSSLGVDVEIWPRGLVSQSRLWKDSDSDKMIEESDDDMGPG